MDKNNISYSNYGGRGITVCDAWVHDFSAFLADVGARPSARYSIDRINNDGNYEPGNVRWATRTEQRRNNRQGVKVVTCRGRQQIIGEWAAESGVSEDAIAGRLRKGWPAERAIFEPVRTHNGIKLTPEQAAAIRSAAPYGKQTSEFARRFGVSNETVRHIVRGKTWRTGALFEYQLDLRGE